MTFFALVAAKRRDGRQTVTGLVIDARTKRQALRRIPQLLPDNPQLCNEFGQVLPYVVVRIQVCTPEEAQLSMSRLFSLAL